MNTIQLNAHPQVATDASDATADQMPFCWGAAGITVLWCFFHGRALLAVGLILLNIVLRVMGAAGGGGGALLATLIGWGVAIYMGATGSTIAMEERGYQTVAELKAGESGWTIAGIIFLAIGVLLTLASFASF
jgi:hypothetical protein